MLIDAILYNGEYDLLQIRYNELVSVVDAFVVVESLEFHGSDKRKDESVFGNPLLGSKIHYTCLDHLEPPFAPETSWLRENYHRNKIMDAVMDLSPSMHDMLMLSDADEIPRAVSLHGRGLDFAQLHGTAQDFFYYNVNNYIGEWHGTVIGAVEAFRNNGSLQDARMQRDGLPLIPNCGWHFSYFGGLSRIRHKVRNFAHANEPICTELKKRPDEEVMRDIAEGRDLYHREGPLMEKRSSDDPRLPKYFLENKERFRSLWTT